jgi:hypothetical protein
MTDRPVRQAGSLTASGSLLRHPSDTRHLGLLWLLPEGARQAADMPSSSATWTTTARELRLGFDTAGRLLEVVVLCFDSGNDRLAAMWGRSSAPMGPIVPGPRPCLWRAGRALGARGGPIIADPYA